MVHHILISSYTNDISTVAFDPSAAKITLVSSTTVGHHPSWITPHPEDPTVIFTGLEQADGKVVVLKYDQDWKGAVVAEGPSGGADPCSLLVAKEKLFVANVRKRSGIPINPCQSLWFSVLHGRDCEIPCL